MKLTVTLPMLAMLAIFFTNAHAVIPEHNPVPGGVAVVRIAGVTDSEPLVQFGGQKVLTITRENHYLAIVGIPMDASPGKYLLTVHYDADNIERIRFRVEAIPASPVRRAVTLPEFLEDVEFEDTDERQQLQTDESPENREQLRPDFQFHQPVPSGSFIPYGVLLRENSNILIQHLGVTYLTKPDGLVYAPSPAIVERVFLDDDSGIVVVLNHGGGLVSHLSNLNDTVLKQGDTIQSGEVLGTAGLEESIDAGRVGWFLALNGNFVDPLQFTFIP